MKYLIFETNSLSTIAEVNGEFKWEHIGTTSKLVKLSDVTIGRNNENTGKLSYVLPIADEVKAEEFRLSAQSYCVVVEIVDELTAVAKRDLLKNQTAPTA